MANLKIKEAVMVQLLFILFLTLGLFPSLSACPTCMGKIDRHKDAPPFFSKDSENYWKSRTAVSSEESEQESDDSDENEKEQK
jgi:hypothetical protein